MDSDGGEHHFSSDAQEFASGKLLFDVPQEGTARLRIVNPSKRGALDSEVLAAIAEQVPLIQAKCLIVTGHERMFSAGYDIGGIPDDVFATEAEKLVAHPFAAAIDALEKFPFPTIAALNGHAIGGGLEVALSCDIRIAARSARVGMPPAKLGLIYSHTGLEKFLQLVGPARTRELFFLGRNIPAERAELWGLVNEVIDDSDFESAVAAMAGEIATNAPMSLSGNKHIIGELLKPGPLSSVDEMRLINLRRTSFVSDDFREGVRAFEQKRKPKWTGR